MQLLLASLRIGGRLVHNSPGVQFTGLLNEVRLWNQPCTLESVREHLHERLVGWEEGLAGYWPMVREGRGWKRVGGFIT